MKVALPYVYKLIHKETGQFYIGYREANKLPAYLDIVEYQSSSKEVRKIGFENFSWEILAEFESGEDAFDYENQLIKESFNDPLSLNKHYDRNGKNRFKTIPHTEESKRKLSEAHTGKTIPKDVREKMSRTKTGKKKSEGHKAKIGESNKGKIFPEDSKVLISRKLGFKPIDVYKYETGEYVGRFNTKSECAKTLGLKGSIGKVLKGIYPHAKGYTFKFVDDESNLPPM